MKISTIQTNPFKEYQSNLDEILSLYRSAESDFVLAPEVCLTDFDYKNFKEAAKFSKLADKALQEEVGKTPLGLSMIEKRKEGFVNSFKIYKKGKVIHSQEKHKLFFLGDEHKYFLDGKKEGIKKFKIKGVSYGVLICFELRFVDLWKELDGVEIILIPAAWGRLRREHLLKLTNALAIANRCFVVLSDLKNENYAGGSGVITPFGNEFRDDRKKILTTEIDLNEIKKMKRFIPYSK